MFTTRLSNKGQIVLPKNIRDSHNWQPGTAFIINDLGDSIILKPIKQFKSTSLDEVMGCMEYKGPKKGLKDFELAIAKGAKGRK